MRISKEKFRIACATVLIVSGVIVLVCLAPDLPSLFQRHTPQTKVSINRALIIGLFMLIGGASALFEFDSDPRPKDPWEK